MHSMHCIPEKYFHSISLVHSQITENQIANILELVSPHNQQLINKFLIKIERIDVVWNYY